MRTLVFFNSGCANANRYFQKKSILWGERMDGYISNSPLIRKSIAFRVVLFPYRIVLRV